MGEVLRRVSPPHPSHTRTHGVGGGLTGGDGAHLQQQEGGHAHLHRAQYWVALMGSRSALRPCEAAAERPHAPPMGGPFAHQRQQLGGDGDAAARLAQQLPQAGGEVLVLEGNDKDVERHEPVQVERGGAAVVWGGKREAIGPTRVPPRPRPACPDTPSPKTRPAPRLPTTAGRYRAPPAAGAARRSATCSRGAGAGHGEWVSVGRHCCRMQQCSAGSEHSQMPSQIPHCTGNGGRRPHLNWMTACTAGSAKTAKEQRRA